MNLQTSVAIASAGDADDVEARRTPAHVTLASRRRTLFRRSTFSPRRLLRATAAILCTMFALAASEDVRALNPPDSGICAFDDGEIAPDEHEPPALPGLWTNPRRGGTGWHVAYLDSGDLAFYWFTYNFQGRPVWFQSEPKPFTGDSQTYELRAFRAKETLEAPPIDGHIAERDYSQYAEVAVRVVPDDRSALAINWRWTSNGVTKLGTECIRDYSRTGPFFQSNGVSRMATPNAAFSGAYAEVQYADWGLYWHVLQIPKRFGEPGPETTYFDVMHVATFASDGYPIWLEAVQEGPPSETSPPADVTYQLRYSRGRYAELNGNGSGYPTAECIEPPFWSQATTTPCRTIRTGLGTLRRIVNSDPDDVGVDQRVDVRLEMATVVPGVPTLTRFQRPTSALPAVNQPSLLPGLVALHRLSKKNQILPDRLRCVADPGVQSCRISIDWAMAPEVVADKPGVQIWTWSLDENGVRISGSEHKEVFALGRTGSGFVDVGVHQMALLRLVKHVDSYSGSGNRVADSHFLTAAQADAAPQAQIDNPSQDGYSVAVGESVPGGIRVSAWSPTGIDRVEFRHGQQFDSAEVIGVEDEQTGEHYTIDWSSTVVGAHTIWAKPYGNGEYQQEATPVSRTIHVVVPPAVAVYHPDSVIEGESVAFEVRVDQSLATQELATVRLLKANRLPDGSSEPGTEFLLREFQAAEGSRVGDVYTFALEWPAEPGEYNIWAAAETEGSVPSEAPPTRLTVAALNMTIALTRTSSASPEQVTPESFDVEVTNCSRITELRHETQRNPPSGPISTVAICTLGACAQHNAVSWTPDQAGPYRIRAIALWNDAATTTKSATLDVPVGARVQRKGALCDPTSSQCPYLHPEYTIAAGFSDHVLVKARVSHPSEVQRVGYGVVGEAEETVLCDTATIGTGNCPTTSTGLWQPSSPGEYVLQGFAEYAFDGSVVSATRIRVAVAEPELELERASQHEHATVGRQEQFQIRAGSPLRLSSTSLLVVDADGGQLSIDLSCTSGVCDAAWTPNVAGSYTILARAEWEGQFDKTVETSLVVAIPDHEIALVRTTDHQNPTAGMPETFELRIESDLALESATLRALGPGHEDRELAYFDCSEQPDGCSPVLEVDWTPLAAGTYSLVAHASWSGGFTGSAEIPLVVLRGDPLALVEDQSSDVPVPDLPTHDPSVGTTGVDAGVSGGAASYAVRIEVPPGRRGMQPEIALDYSSRAGNGPLGMGWSLSAGSSIHRCPQTIAHDGRVRGVQLDDQDRLCLDGQRLVVVPGTCAAGGDCYGQDGTTYTTETESFVRITQHGGLADSVHFRVLLPTGGARVYGSGQRGDAETALDAVSLLVQVSGNVTGSGKELAWHLAYEADPQDNSISYYYEQKPFGETLLDRIEYTGSSGSGATRSVEFTYQQRADVSSSYIAQHQLKQTHRLEQIRTAVADATSATGDVTVRTWTLEYVTSASTGRSLLESVAECARDPASESDTADECRMPLVFSWQHAEPEHAFGEASSLSPDSNPLHEYLGDFATSVRFQAVADYNGDGARDILWVGPKGFDDSTPTARIITLSPDRTVTNNLDVSEAFDGRFGNDGRLRIDFHARADFDLDGRPELLGQEDGLLTMHFWHAAASSASATRTFDEVFTTTWRTNIPVTSVVGSVRYVGDVDGVAGPEIVTISEPTCGRQEVSVYRLPNAPAAQGRLVQVDFDLLEQITLDGECSVIGRGQKLDRVSDFDGDGLMDFWISDGRSHDAHGIRLGTSATSGYAIGSFQKFSALTVSGQGLTQQERHAELSSLYIDVNGDGLEDWLYPLPVEENKVYVGRWTLRLNVGGRWSGRTVFTGEGSTHGIEHCGRDGTTDDCHEVWRPWRADRFRPADLDSDGRLSLLVPTSYAGRICTVRVEPLRDGVDCSPVRSDPRTTRPPVLEGVVYPASSMVFSTRDEDVCIRRAYCPETFGTGALEAPNSSGFVKLRDARGVPSERWPVDEFISLFRSGGASDISSYHMSALSFRESAAGMVLDIEDDTGIIAGGSSADAMEDVYGDGHEDLLTKVSCYAPGPRPDLAGCGIIDSYEKALVVVRESPLELPNGIPLMTPQPLINEGQGAGIPAGEKAAGGKPPKAVDVMNAAIDGLGNRVEWDYSPLGARAQSVYRDAAGVPLYSVPDFDRYIDERHFYFTSSMPVVAEMRRSTGLGATDLRTFVYGYSEAMYNIEGRGLQGFRTITAYDSEADTRSITDFHQRFPLTSRIESVTVEQRVELDGSVEWFPLSTRTLRWSCDPQSTANLAGCSEGAGAPLLPYAAEDERLDYSPAPAECATNPVLSSCGIDARLVRGQRERPATPLAASCDSFQVDAASSLDAYGRVTDRTVLTWDAGPDPARPIEMHCERTQSSFLDPVADLWKLDRLGTQTITRSVRFNDAEWSLADAPSARVTTLRREWTEGNGTLVDLEFVQEGKPNEEIKTDYGYDAYGNVDDVKVEGDGDANASRTTSTVYDAEGYFPETVTRGGSDVLHTTSSAWRASDGQPEWTQDPNGAEQRFQYDAFGVLRRTLFEGHDKDDGSLLAAGSENDPRAAWPRHVSRDTVVSGCGLGSRAVFREVTVQMGAPTTSTCHDSFGRVVRATTLLPGGISSHVDTRYDRLGRVVWHTEPHAGSTHGGSATTGRTEYSGYDVLGRPGAKTVRRGDPVHGDLETSYVYEGRRTRITVCGTSGTTPQGGCLNMSRLQDAFGRHVETVDAAQSVADAPSPTRYWFDAAGNTVAVRDVSDNWTRATYNDVGHRTTVDDPNQGAWTFDYNALGELTSQTDARAITTSFEYDSLGRQKARRAAIDIDADGEPDSVADLTVWDGAVNGVGRIQSTSRSVQPGSGSPYVERSTTFGYDARGRRVTETIHQHGREQPLLLRWRYDHTHGRLRARAWGSDEGVLYTYDNLHGHLLEERDSRSLPGDASGLYREHTAWDERGRLTGFTLGGTVHATRVPDSRSGAWTRIEYQGAGVGYALGYSYDLFGNLHSRTLQHSTTETFVYDALHRLEGSTRSNGAPALSYSYDAAGNLLCKSDYSQASSCNEASADYSYLGARPNAVGSVTLKGGATRSFGYDANGNMTSATGAGTFSAAYDHSNLPVRTRRGDSIVDFRYGPDNRRTRQLGPAPRTYFDDYEETPTRKSFHLGDYGIITLPTDGDVGQRKVEYFASDRLGSIVAVFDAGGSLVEGQQRGYDPFGRPRQADWTDFATDQEFLPQGSPTPRGYTRHEHLDDVQLIHMNGRAFDYNLGRFLGVDPYIQFPLNSQSLNPYSYILNNPMAGTDPTGYETCQLTDNASCLEDGVNTVTNSDGDTVGHVVVGQKGDNIAFTGSTDPGRFGIASSGINIALNPKNGADSWVKNGPEGSDKIGSSGKGCAGGGPLQCYNVFTDKRGRRVEGFERTFETGSGRGAINGMLNNLGRAINLIAQHVHKRLGAGDGFMLAHNPTEGFMRDLIESTRDKLGITTPAARQFADVLAGADGAMDWVAHSQGGIIFSEASRLNANRGVHPAATMRVAFNSGANNRWATNRTLGRAGIGLYGQGYFDPPNDLVPQWLGLRGLLRPDHMMRSLLSAPSLFGDGSPHTPPYGD